MRKLIQKFSRIKFPASAARIKLIGSVTGLAVFSLLFAISMSARPPAPTKADKRLPASEIPNVLLVKVKPGARLLLQTNADLAATGVSGLDTKIRNKKFEVKTERIVKPSKKAKLESDLARWVKIKIKNPGTAATDLDGNVYYPDVEQLVEQLKSDPDVEAVQKENKIKRRIVPNDPFYSSTGHKSSGVDDMWGLKAINAALAWDISRGSPNIVVAVVDSGVDLAHPDLVNNIWTNPGEIAGNSVDDDGNGYVDDIHGWNFGDNCGSNTCLNDTEGHGTHIAGTVSAQGNNATGVVGVNWTAKIMALPDGGTDSGSASAWHYAADNGAKVTNNSWGTTNAAPNLMLQDALKYAHDHGVTTAVAPDNGSADSAQVQDYPANDADAISVGAAYTSKTKTSFSNYGTTVDVIAPGQDILSTKASGWTYGSSGCPSFFGGKYCFMDGTSMATPHVAGLAALMLSVNPSLSPEQIRQILRTTALDVGAAGRDMTNAYGFIQANAALAAAQNPTVLTPHISFPRYAGTISKLTTVRGSFGGPNLASAKLEIGSGNTPTSWTALCTATAAIPNDTNLCTFNTYSYSNGTYALRLSATNTSGKIFEHSVYLVKVNNTADTTAPSQPGNLTGTPSATNMVLNWSASTDSGSGVRDYIVKRGSTTLANVPVGTTTYNDSGLTAGTSYAYSVQARDYAGNLSTATTSTFTTSSDTAPPPPPPPPPPVDTTPPLVTITNPIENSTYTGIVQVTFDASDSVGVARVELYKDGGKQYAATQPPYNWAWDTSVQKPNTKHQLIAKAFDAAGNVGEKIIYVYVGSSTTPPPPDTTPPTTPGSLAGQAVTTDQINLSWNASTDSGGSGLAGYRVYRNDLGSVPRITLGASAVSWGEGGLAADTSYTYTIKAFDAAGNESPAASVAVRTLANSPPPPPGTGPCGSVATAPAKYAHVIWIWMDSKTYSQVIPNSSAPYINSLAQQCGSATNYYQLTKVSLANYVGATSGGTQNITDNLKPSSYSLQMNNLFRQVRAAGMGEKSYQESMGSNCQLSNSGSYITHHNPAAYYNGDSGRDRSACQKNNVPLGSVNVSTGSISGNLANDLNNNTLPTFSFITPNTCNNSYSCSLATSDKWLKAVMTSIINSNAYKAGNTAVGVMYDKYSPMPHLGVAPAVKPGRNSSANFTHYSLLRTTEEMLGINTFLGSASSAKSMRADFNL